MTNLKNEYSYKLLKRYEVFNLLVCILRREHYSGNMTHFEKYDVILFRVQSKNLKKTWKYPDLNSLQHCN